MIPRRAYACAVSFVVWTAGCAGRAGASEKQAGTIDFLWPIHAASLPLSAKDQKSLEDPWVGEELAQIGLNKFEAYMRDTLPRELEMDQQFARQFHDSDHSRINLAFLRWQRRAWAENEGIDAERLTSRGESVPKLDGISYEWPELYTSSAFRRLRARINEASKLYIKRSGWTTVPKKLHTFIWVEVFKQGDAYRPGARTDGAYVTGRYFATCQKGSLKLNFEDPRGINPPYGKTFSHAPYEGNLALFPTWVSHFITPNMQNRTAVTYTFLVYPDAADGGKLHWKDDMTARIEISRTLSSKKSKAPVNKR